jgi:DNA-binding beta-propeller fold protein YncE
MRPAPLALLASLCAVLGQPAAARADLVYVLNSGDASITVLDGVAREEERHIPVLREPHHLVLTPDRRSLLVGDSSGNELLYLDPATAAVQRRERLSNPYHLDFSPDGAHLVIASLRRDQVDIYAWDAEENTPVLRHRLRVGDKPSHLAFSPDGRTVFVTLQGARGLLAIDLASGQPAWQMEVGREPAGVLWHRGRLIVGIMGADHFVVVDPETRTLERTVPVGRGAHTIFAAPDGRTLYATSRVDSRIAALDAATLEVRRVWEVPGGPDCITFDPEGRVWATLRWIGRIAVIDPAAEHVETIRVGRSPHGILFQPRRGQAVAQGD